MASSEDEAKREQINLGRVATASAAWIQSADTKATAIIALGAALIAVVAGMLAVRSTIAELDDRTTGLMVLFLVATTASILFSCAALYPRTNRAGLLLEKSWKGMAKSPSYFGDVACVESREAFLALMKEDPLEDSREQALVVALIAHKKMRWLTASVISIGIACALLAAFTCLGVFGSSKPIAGAAPVPSPSASTQAGKK